jgi:hypothetical protein
MAFTLSSGGISHPVSRPLHNPYTSNPNDDHRQSESDVRYDVGRKTHYNHSQGHDAQWMAKESIKS